LEASWNKRQEEAVMPTIGIEPIVSETAGLQSACPPWASWLGAIATRSFPVLAGAHGQPRKRQRTRNPARMTLGAASGWVHVPTFCMPHPSLAYSEPRSRRPTLFQSTYFFATPYLERPFLRGTRSCPLPPSSGSAPRQSRLPLTTLYLTPGQSGTRPPRIRT
jgi:hypothetical protein